MKLHFFNGITFSEAATVFGDPLGITAFDPDSSDEEDRYILVGASARGRLLLIAHTNRDDEVRIITARELTRTERRAYENKVKSRKG